MAQKEEIDIKEFKLINIEMTICDENDEKLNNEEYRLIFLDGTIITGKLDSGKLIIENVPDLPYILVVDGYVYLEEEE